MRGVEVVEVGPGPGGLTRSLLMEGAAKVHVIEADPRFTPALEDIASAYPGRVEIHMGDARKISPHALVSGPYKIVANLPYNVATPLLIAWLKILDGATVEAHWQSMTLMFQKEVADRITATPGQHAFGRLAVIAGVLADARQAFDVDARVFVPPPKVTSAIVHLSPSTTPRIAVEIEALERITAACFGQRRKMLRASLKSLCSSPEALCARASIDPTQRAEALSIEDFCALANALDAK